VDKHSALDYWNGIPLQEIDPKFTHKMLGILF